MRFVGTAYRAHDPRWSFKPISGAGAAIRGARFNPRGVPALYLGLGIMTAIKEANQGFAHRIDPCVLCSYDIDCDDIADLSTPEGRRAAGVMLDDLACAWALALAEGRRPASWDIHDRLAARGIAGIAGHAVILNTPGSTKGCVECLEAVIDVLPHALRLLTEQPTEH